MKLVVWRHPRPRDVAGLCLGLTDAPVDARKAKRLAHRIRARARRERTAQVVWTSALTRSATVGRWLRRWGWRHHIDVRLNELDFGTWDGLPWSRIPVHEIDAWCARFNDTPAGGGESVASLLARCEAFIVAQADKHDGVQVVSHAGWINAARWVMAAKPLPHRADEWPAAVGYSSAVTLAR